MPATERIDAVIPTFNAPPERLAAAVSSCLAEPQIARVLVIDDGSATPATVPPEPRVTVIRQANGGPSAARNRGIDAANAEFVLFLDDDDLLLPGALGPMIHLADRLGAAAVVGARIEQQPSGERQLKPVPQNLADRAIPFPGEVFRPISLFGASGALVRRSVLGENLRFDPDLWIGEDREFLRRIAELGPLAVSAHTVFVHRLHEAGSNLTSGAHLARRVRDHLIVMSRFFDDESRMHWEHQTLWLLNAVAKKLAGNRGVWDELASAARAHGWKIPLRARLRVAASGERAVRG